jgi:hypothetical protein
MSSTNYTIGGASILVESRPASENAPVDPRVIRAITSFLAVMEKAALVEDLGNFSQWTDGFVEEVDNYLEKHWLEMIGHGDLEVDLSPETIEREMLEKLSKKE